MKKSINENFKTNNDKLFFELIKKQNKIIVGDKKLLYNDLKRISKYLSKSIFDDSCSLWNGYITVVKNDVKKSYINFYFNGKKYALHRLLYINYIGKLDDSEYIKFNCQNKGVCCNINHFYKINKDYMDCNTIKNVNNIACDNITKNVNNTDMETIETETIHTEKIPINIIVGFN